MSTQLLAQFIGLIAVLISLSVFQTNKRSTMLKLGMTAAVLYSFHFYFLGAVTGAAMNAIGVGRCYAFNRIKPTKHNVWILFVFMGISVIATYLTWQGPLSFLALAGHASGGIAFWQRKPKLIRRWALFAPPTWFTYNAISGSYPGMFIEVVMLVSNLVGEYRFDVHHKSHAQKRLARPA